MHAAGTKEALKNLETAIQGEVDATKPPSPDDREGNQRYQERNMGRSILGQITAALSREEPGQLDEYLAQVPVYFKSEEVRKQAEQLGAILRKEREAKDAAFVREVETAVKRAGEAVRKAKEPAELDASLHELGQMRNHREDRLSKSARAAMSKVQPTLQFVQRWQDYLSAAKSGNATRITEILRNLSSTGENIDLLPRSEILR